MFELEINGVASALDVSSVRGTERLSAPYAFDVEVWSRRSTLTDQVGDAARLTLDVGGVVSVRHGILDRITALGSDGARFRYRLHLVPELAGLGRRSNCRIFQDQTTEDVIATLLDEHGVDSFEIAMTGHRSPRTVLVQYHETDLDFLQRLVDEEGLFYFFEHRSDEYTMIIADASDAYRTRPGGSGVIEYAADSSEPNSASRFERSVAGAVDAVTLRDTDPLEPSLDLEVTARVPRRAGTDEIFGYPGGYSERADGEQRAAWRLAAEYRAQSSATATTNSPLMMPGHTFELTDHPVGVNNATYVVAGVTHTGEQTGRESSYENVATWIDAAMAFRTTGRSRGPVIHGPQTAVVVGPVGEDIHVDEYGRVKVQFRWDRDGQLDENSSAWIRVAQASAGDGWGSVVIPRIGQEVLVSFLDGDPDRPVIVGSLYNGDHRAPYELPDNKNLTAFTTRTTPDGGGHHELVFDDTSGAEQVRLSSSGHLALTAAAGSRVSVGIDHAVDVGGDELREVGGDLRFDVGGDEAHRVGNDLRVEVGGDVDQTVGTSFRGAVGKRADVRANSIVVTAEDEIRLVVGRARLVMKRDGSIAITGTKVSVRGSERLDLKGPSRR